MKYMMFVYWDAEAQNAQADPTPEELAKLNDYTFPWLDEVMASGKRLDGDMLAPPRRAQTVRVRDGRLAVTEGPFAETKEAIGGFDILECDSLDEAVKIAAEHPVAKVGTIEVRPYYGG